MAEEAARVLNSRAIRLLEYVSSSEGPYVKGESLWRKRFKGNEQAPSFSHRLDALVEMGLLERRGDGFEARYRPTAEGARLLGFYRRLGKQLSGEAVRQEFGS